MASVTPHNAEMMKNMICYSMKERKENIVAIFDNHSWVTFSSLFGSHKNRTKMRAALSKAPNRNTGHLLLMTFMIAPKLKLQIASATP